MCNVGQSGKHRSRSRKSTNFSRSRQFNYQNIPFDLTKKMNTHILCFCPLIRKLQAFEILKWAKESQWTKQRTSNFTREIQLFIFSRLWNTAFLRYALYLNNIFLYFITLYIIKQKNNLISQPKYMWRVLKRTVSMRRFFWAPTTCVLAEKQENNYNFTLIKFPYLHLCL